MVAERILVPQAGVRSRRALLTHRLRDIYEFRYLVRTLAVASLQVERVSFAFGFVWWMLDPLMMVTIWTFVIVGILGRGTGIGGPFPLFLMAAMLPWQFMTRATMGSVYFTQAKELQMRQIAFPRGVLPLSKILAESVKLMIALALFPVAALAFGVRPSPVQLLAVPLVPILMAITLGIAWFLSALNFVFRDTGRLMNVLFRLWLFLSPVFYTFTLVPAGVRPLYELNPMSYILQCFRSVLFYQRVPNVAAVAGSIVAAVVCVTVGFVFFHTKEPRFARLN